MALAFCLLNAPLVAQTIYPINVGSVTACAGGLVTTNGLSGGGYENNEDHVITICPDEAGQATFITFVSFDLSLAGPAPVDQFVIYDGDNVSAPVIGTYTGGALQGQIIAASPDNASGCLTLHFTSNNIGEGIFSGVINCGTPCWPPTPNAAVVNELLPAKVCIDEVVGFDASQSQPHPTRTIVDYEWNMDDGNVFNGPLITHSFNEPGQYMVSLRVTDDVGCTNTQQTSLAVWVGTEPVFAGTTGDTTVCAGATLPLVGRSEAVTWNELPTVDLGGQIDLPDQVGQLFTSSIEFTVFPSTSVVTNATDLSTFCVSMEHTFIGDFVLGLTCPNGQNVILHQQGGGGTFLGDANDQDGGSNIVPGTCWDYCFSSTATLGTWAASAQFGTSPNVTPTSQGTALIPGTYSPVDPFSDLIGCPLNGVWTLTYVDQWGGDNGTMCNWSINFNPSLYPDLTEFTPIIGTTADSVGWSGPYLTHDPVDPRQVIITPTDPGTFDYTFSVTDDFGCTHDTTIHVTVIPPPVVEASVLQGLCTAQSQLQATIVANPPTPPACPYMLILNDSYQDGWSGGARVTVTVNGQATNHTLTAGSTTTIIFDVPYGATFTVSYTPGTWNTENSYQLLNTAGTVLYNSPSNPPSGTVWSGTSTCAAATDLITYVWTPANGVTAADIANPHTTITTPTFFTVAVYPHGQPWCTTQDTITVQSPSVLENDSIITHVLCYGGNGSAEIETQGLGGPWTYSWRDANNTIVRTTNAAQGDALSTVAGTYSVVVTEGPNGNGCSDTVEVTITEPPLLEMVSISSDTLICMTGEAMISASATGGTAPITLLWDHGLPSADAHTVQPTTSTVYAVRATDAHGCLTNGLSVLVGVRDSIRFTPFVDMEQCSGVPFTLSVANVSGGDSAYTYLWSTGASTLPELTDSLTDDATLCVTVSDGCETPPVISCIAITVLHTPALEVTADTVFGCRPFAVSFSLRDTTHGATVQWHFGDGAVSETGTLVDHIYNRSDRFDVTPVVTWPNGCVTDTTLQDLVQVIPVPRPEFSYKPDPLTIFEPHARFNEEAGPNEVGYAWDFFAFGTSSEPDPEVTFPNDIGRLYPVQLVVWNQLGCSDTLLREIAVEDVHVIHAPNAFTPNGDGLNEQFLILGNDVSDEEFELVIFDRWGKVVFKSVNPGSGWDGNFPGGGKAEVGVYNWRLKVRSMATLEKHIQYGHVNLIR